MLPRRVPWATLAELDQLCSWIYAEDCSRGPAIERLSAWRFMMPLPHALESLLSILVAVQQDISSDAGLSSSLSLRQSYATALIRLVNGLVDPLQMGTYARSILSIATQIGLPAWLVELRHAATHEDLPSLELLRDGAKESLTWLLHNYFLPTLNPALAHATAAPPPPPRAPALRPVEPLLRRYKSLLKTISRDASLRARHAADISGTLREIERWLSEARVAAHTHASDFASWLPYPGRPGGDRDEDDDEDDDGGPEPREAWALDKLCEALLVKGALVPVSRKKRVSPKGNPFRPPSSLLSIWVPLLESVSANHVHFPATLTLHIIAHLLADNDDSPNEDDRDDAGTTAVIEKTSYDVCLAAWGAWLVEWRHGHGDESDTDVAVRRQDVFFRLIQALSSERKSSSQSRPGVQALLTALCASDGRLSGISATILGAMQVSEDAPAWCESDLDVMEARQKAALSLSTSAGHIQSPVQNLEQGFLKNDLPNGWRRLSELGGWRPCPIGVYVGGE